MSALVFSVVHKGQKELCDEFIGSSCHESSCYAPFEVMFGTQSSFANECGFEICVT